MSPETRTFRPTSKRSPCSLKPSYGVSSQPNSELAPSRTRVAFRLRASLASASTGDGAARARGDGPTHWRRSHLWAATCNGRVIAVSPPRAARISPTRNRRVTAVSPPRAARVSVRPRATTASPPCHRHAPRARLCALTRNRRVTAVQPPCHRVTRRVSRRRRRLSAALLLRWRPRSCDVTRHDIGRLPPRGVTWRGAGGRLSCDA